MDSTLPSRRIVLLGIGHTNAHVLRMWRMKPLPDTQLVCISNYPCVTYSGMLPGTLAGLYPHERMTIDLVRLCAAADSRLIVGQVTDIDVQGHQVLFADRPPLSFDVLSIGIGSVPTRDGVESLDETVLRIKPMQTFLERLEGFVDQWLHTPPMSPAHPSQSNIDRPFHVTVVGGGVAGTEIAFCLPARLWRLLGGRPFHVTLIERGGQICGGLSPGARRRAEQELQRREVHVHCGKAVCRVRQGRVVMEDGAEIDTDLVLWATGAAAPPLLTSLQLPKDNEGFLLTRATLQTLSSDSIFAVGDTGTIQSDDGTPVRLPKAGVYAVRQGPVLWANLRRKLDGEPLVPYQPQRSFLRLLATGDGRAIVDYKGMAAHARWCWRLKDAIDGRFMDKYQDYRPMTMQHPSSLHTNPASDAPLQRRCAGCGGKVGASVLSNVLARLEIVDRPGVVLGLSAPDDAAVLRTAPECDTVVTSDFFAAPFDDPYLVGRIAAVNALSDVFATGGRPTAAIAHVTLPGGSGNSQEDLLYELLAGGVRELNAHETALVGGHTTEGPELTIGFTVIGCVKSRHMLTKGGLRAGDVLVLTKPLGTGVLLAALMQAKLPWPSWEPLVATMLRSNSVAAGRLRELDARGVTDITGFGLAGHLHEMLVASNAAAEIDLDRVPLLPGAVELLEQGIRSTLAPANRHVESSIDADEHVRASPRYAALFDPQTSGGLLIGVPQDRVDALRDALAGDGAAVFAMIGRVVANDAGSARIRIGG